MDFEDHQTREGRIGGITRDYTPLSPTTKKVLAFLIGFGIGLALVWVTGM